METQMYNSFMLKQIEKCEQSKKVYTTNINQRNIMTIPNDFKDLVLLLQYIKQNPIVNLPTNTVLRSHQYLQVPQFDINRGLSSSLISINKENLSRIQDICTAVGVSYLLLKRKHINSLDIGNQEQIKNLFNAFDIVICPNQLISDLNKVLVCNQVFKTCQIEKDTLQTQLIQCIFNDQLTSDEVFNNIKQIREKLAFYKHKPMLNDMLTQVQGVRICLQTGFWFQRNIYLQQYSSRCNKNIAAKLHWVLLYGGDIQIHKELTFNLHPIMKDMVNIDTSKWHMEQILKQRPFVQQGNAVNHIVSVHKQSIFNKIPINTIKYSTVNDIIKALPFQQYDIKDALSIQNAVQGFVQATANIPRFQTYNPTIIQNVIQNKQQEECIICYIHTNQWFVFGCCGCHISIQCIVNLIQAGSIKCPNCRYVIRNDNLQLGALFLDNIANQTNSLNYNSNITIIHNGVLHKRATLIDQQPVHIVFNSDTSLTSTIQWFRVFISYLEEVPENKPIKLSIYATQYIDQIRELFNNHLNPAN